MRPAPISTVANDVSGTWLIRDSEAWEFEPKDDPNDPAMLLFLRFGAAILFITEAGTDLQYRFSTCSEESFETSINASNFPLNFVEMFDQLPTRTAPTVDAAHAISNDILMYRVLKFTDQTAVIDRPPSQLQTSTELLNQTLDAWRGNSEFQSSSLVELYEVEGSLFIKDMGLDSLATRYFGEDWVASMRDSPALPENPNQYEIAVHEGYRKAFETGEPVIQDIRAKFEKSTNDVFYESYRRLIIPISTDKGERRLLVAAEDIGQFLQPGRFKE